jgi:DNA-3-methyladenine glycosylase
MPGAAQLTRPFYARNTVMVARQLLGKRLVRLENGSRLSGMIVEAEAYRGEEDQACHARSGRTRRTQVMYGPPGHAYVYFTYGMHWMLNFVTEDEGFPAAVLIRAILPEEGVEVMQRRRSGQPPPRWTDGPAKVCQALQISGHQHGLDLCSPQAEIFVEEGDPIPEASVTSGPRVGLYTVPEPWKSIRWNFQVKLNPFQR